MGPHPMNDPTNPLHRIADDAARMANGGYPANQKALSGIADDITATLDVTYGLVGILTKALPYIESAEADESYKPGVVSKISAEVRAAIQKATGQ